MNLLQATSLLIVLAGVFGSVNYFWLRLPPSIGVLVVALAASVGAMLLDLVLPSLGLAQNAHHRHRIGRRDQRAENEGHEKRHSGNPAKAKADNSCREADAERCHEKDHDGLFTQG